MKNIQDYIESGILESYALGMASPEEVKELQMIKKIYPEIEMALHNLEVDMERIASAMAIQPPPATWLKIESELNALLIPKQEPVVYKEFAPRTDQEPAGPTYIEVEAISNEMRVNKAWKWVFAAVFVLGKIFVGCAIYFYLENRQAQEQVQQLKTEIKTLKR